ncbi:MAG: hypothetical protein R2780_05205 [Crocinitomicaceae bacterium]|nr:hypothetical protein [Crocinitomicaceae bacterium]
MNWKLHSAVAIYLISFALPVIEINALSEPKVLYGWEAALGIANMSEAFQSMNWFDNKIILIIQMIWFNLANPLILIVIIMSYANSKNERLKWTLGTIALLSAFSWFPYMITLIMYYFSFGYFCWIIGILMIYFYSNGSSFKRPAKNA